MTELFHSNRLIWQSETFWNCYSRRNGLLFQEKLLLKATNTNNNPKVVDGITWTTYVGCRDCQELFVQTLGPKMSSQESSKFSPKMPHWWNARGRKVSHWNVRFELKDRNVVEGFFWKLLRIFGKICFNICVIVFFFLSMTQMY